MSWNIRSNVKLLLLHALRMAWIWRLMLIVPGEDFLDVIAKVLSPTDNIDYKLLLWHPDIPGSLALYPEVTKICHLGTVNCVDFISLPFFLTIFNRINSPYYVSQNWDINVNVAYTSNPISLLTLFLGKWDIGMQAGEPIYWHGDKSFCPNLGTFNVPPSSHYSSLMIWTFKKRREKGIKFWNSLQ